MKKPFEYPPKRGKHFLLRLLLLFAVLALWSMEVLAQDTTLARVPQVELIPVRQREVMDHYINKMLTPQGWQLEVFDGAKELVLNFSDHEQISISPNQKYFTVAKPITSNKNIKYEYDVVRGTFAYDVELRNLKNTLLAKGRILSLQSDEAYDLFTPGDDGLGLVQWSNYACFGFNVFQCKNGNIVNRFGIDNPNCLNNYVYYAATAQVIFTAFDVEISLPYTFFSLRLKKSDQCSLTYQIR